MAADSAVLKNYQTSDQLCQAVSDRSGCECILAFSRGKDCIAAYAQLKKYFTKIHFYHLFLIPNLSFVDSYLRYWEDLFGVEVLNLPHPSLYRLFGNLVFQAPDIRHSTKIDKKFADLSVSGKE